MLLFGSRRKRRQIQSYVTRLLNYQCHDPRFVGDEQRQAERSKVTLVALLTPMRGGRPYPQELISVVVKDLSAQGMSAILDEKFDASELLVGFRMPDDLEMTHIRSHVRHRRNMGGGFRQVGLEFDEVFDLRDFPELRVLHI